MLKKLKFKKETAMWISVTGNWTVGAEPPSNLI